jgi:flagellin-like protein
VGLKVVPDNFRLLKTTRSSDIGDRMKLRLLQSKRGVSPLIATLILISITVAAGVSVYALVSGMIGTMSSILNIQVNSIDVIQAGSNTLLAVTIQNSGNIQINSCTITITGDSGTATLNLGAINPGQTASATVSNPSGFGVTIGNAYPVSISVTATGGSTLAKALTVTCTGN